MAIIEGICAVGELALQRQSLVEALVDTRGLEKTASSNKKPLIVILELRLNTPYLRIDSRQLDGETLREVLWVGNAAGSNSPQDRLTTDNLIYLASQTLPNLLRALPEERQLKKKLEELRDTIFVDLGEKEEVFPGGGGDQQYERYRWVWDLVKLGIDPGIALKFLGEKDREEAEAISLQAGVQFLSREFLQIYARRKQMAKEVCNLVGKVLEAWIARELGVESSQLCLYTLALEGELLARDPDYISYLEHKLVEEAFEGDAAAEGVCHLCGVKGRITADTARFEFLKFYITDKPGFASHFSKKGFINNYTLCPKCYKKLLSGERFVENMLRTRLGNTNVYLIPTFHAAEAQPRAEILEEWAEYLKARLAAAETLEKWREFQMELEKYQLYENKKALFVLNFLFATKARAAVKVDKLIPEVPPSRLDRLDEVRNRVRDWAVGLLGEDARGEWDLGFSKLFYLLPIRKRGRDVDAKLYLELLDALLAHRPLGAQMVIPQFLETACIHRFERYDSYAHTRAEDSERALVLHLLQSQLFLLYLKDLGQLSGLKGGETKVDGQVVGLAEEGMLEEDLRAWMDRLGLDTARRGLFLLGVLIGRIGSTSEQLESKKPILNKVHFQGMDRTKIMRLANEVYEKLRQYKVADRNEGVYAVMKAYLDRSLGELFSPQENTYWVLSGYAYATWQAMRRGSLRKQAEVELSAGEVKEGKDE